MNGGAPPSSGVRAANTLAPVVALLCCACVAAAPTGGDAAPQPGEVAFDLVGPGGAALVVPVKVNDAGPFPFVLDTGATVTCLDEPLVKELSLPDAPGMVAIGGGLRGFGSMRLVSLESVALGDASVRDLQGCAIDLGPMRKAGLEVRGLLGLNFLRSYTLTIDFSRRTVRVERPGDEPVAAP
jgi:hypothetical protein